MVSLSLSRLNITKSSRECIGSKVASCALVNITNGDGDTEYFFGTMLGVYPHPLNATNNNVPLYSNVTTSTIIC